LSRHFAYPKIIGDSSHANGLRPIPGLIRTTSRGASSIRQGAGHRKRPAMEDSGAGIGGNSYKAGAAAE